MSGAESMAFLLLGVNAHALAVLADALEVDLSVHQSEQRVVGTDADVRARMNVGAALAHQNIAGQNELSVRPFCERKAECLSAA